jgi:type IX secretion system PorP/SprF family membrane protein
MQAQDIHFSQLTQSPLTTNPALAGTGRFMRANMQFRTQWAAVTTSYKTMAASLDIKSKNKWGKQISKKDKARHPGDNGFGWGVNLFNDNTGGGKINTFQLDGSLAYQICLNENKMIALGFQGGMLQRTLRSDPFHWGNQYDPLSVNGYNTSLAADPAAINADDNFIVPDLGVGGVYTYRQDERKMPGSDQRELTIGAALFHVNMPRYSFLSSNERLYQRLVLHANALIGIENTNLAIAPSATIQRQGPNQEIVLGSLFRYTIKEDSKYTGYVKSTFISAGGYYRNRDAIILAGLLEFSNYAVGLSYDINVSSLSRASSGRGGVEFTFRYTHSGVAMMVK